MTIVAAGLYPIIGVKQEIGPNQKTTIVAPGDVNAIPVSVNDDQPVSEKCLAKCLPRR